MYTNNAYNYKYVDQSIKHYRILEIYILQV